MKHIIICGILCLVGAVALGSCQQANPAGRWYKQPGNPDMVCIPIDDLVRIGEVLNDCCPCSSVELMDGEI